MSRTQNTVAMRYFDQAQRYTLITFNLKMELNSLFGCLLLHCTFAHNHPGLFDRFNYISIQKSRNAQYRPMSGCCTAICSRLTD